MGNAAQLMGQQNAALDVGAINNMIKDFSKESDKMGMKMELVNDGMDMLHEDTGEADNIYN